MLQYLRQYQKNPTSRVFAPLADQFRKMGQPEEGLKICLEGLQNHPRYPGGRVALAHCYVDLKRYEEALKEYEFVLAQFPDNLHAIRGAGRCYQALNQTEKAIRYYRMYNFLVPKDTVVREQLKGLEGQLKMHQQPPGPPKEKGSQGQLLLDSDMDQMSNFDHFRLSSITGARPVQRVFNPPVGLGSPPYQVKVKFLYKLLGAIQKKRSQGQLDGSIKP